MEYGSIERELYIDASPEVVFEVVSRPEHIREWWPDDITLDSRPGGAGELHWGGGDSEPPMTQPLTVVDLVPPHRFSFRWAYEAGLEPDATNSFFVTFELSPSGTGTRVRFVETGFREQGWEAAVLEAAYLDHVEGWNKFLPKLVAYAPTVVSVP